MFGLILSVLHQLQCPEFIHKIQLLVFRSCCLPFILLTFLLGCDDEVASFQAITTSASGTSMQVSIVRASDSVPTTQISPNATGRLVVELKRSDDSAVVSHLVSFTSEIVTFNPANGVALTDSSGTANIVIQENGIYGAGSVTVTATVDGEQLTVPINFTVVDSDTISTDIQIGNGSGTSFTNGALLISTNPISAGGTTSVTASVVDASNVLYQPSLSVVFTSSCVEANLASIDGSVNTVNGTAQATYRANGCEGVDTITATATLGGSTYTATGDVTVNSASAGSIEFVSATPNQLQLSGTGGQGLSSQSTVTFRALSAQGLPLANQEVNFSLTTELGGITLSPDTVETDSDGLASTIVQSGNVATAVGVIATIDGTTISTQSDLLTITTGVPDQNSVSLSASVFNPEAFEIDGTQSTISVRMADIFNNPVPDGTAVTFTAEGGSIGSSCTTVGGVCSVTWSSQNPRPSNGRATILATAIGNESYIDANGNGVFDAGDSFGPSDDLPEAFVDYNEDDAWDLGEPFVDFNNNMVFDAADTQYNGTPCSSNCSETTKTVVRDSLVLTMSGTTPTITIDNLTTAENDISSVFVATSVTLRITVQDINGNRMPAETTIAISANNGTYSGSEGVTVPNVQDAASTPRVLIVQIANDGESSSDTLTVTVETPSGNEFIHEIFVND